MSQSKIIQSLRDAVDDKILYEDKEYEKRSNEVSKWLELLDKYLKGDDKLSQVFYKYDMAEGLQEAREQDIFFREGFLCGARLMLEICGYKEDI